MKPIKFDKFVHNYYKKTYSSISPSDAKQQYKRAPLLDKTVLRVAHSARNAIAKMFKFKSPKVYKPKALIIKSFSFKAKPVKQSKMKKF